MGLSCTELKDIEKVVVEFLRKEVGPLVKSTSGTSFGQYDDKANEVDLVTKVDKQVEAMTKQVLMQKYPSFKFIGEESYVPGETKITDDPTFIVDPIDGTTNFIHGFPYSCTSVGLAEHGKPVLGVVYNPHLNEMFHASKGNGAFLNGSPINVAKRPLTLQKSVIALEGGAQRAESNFESKIETCRNLLSEQGGYVHAVRSLGSAAMNMCYVANGTLDAYWEGGPWAWDVCAGWCILEEAGGMMVGGNPGTWQIAVDGRCYLAVRGGTDALEQRSFIEHFWKHVDKPLVY